VVGEELVARLIILYSRADVFPVDYIKLILQFLAIQQGKELTLIEIRQTSTGTTTRSR
jgi:hypothetical protein